MGKSRTETQDKEETRIPKGDGVSKLTGKQRQHYRRRQRSEGATGRFCDSGAMRYHSYGTGIKPAKLNSGRIRRHDNDLVIRTLKLCYEIGTTKAAKAGGISYGTAYSWFRRRFLPKTGSYTFSQMIKLITLARRYYLVSKCNPLTCLRWAVDRMPKMTWREVRQYLYLQAMPTLPGFPLYADRMVNEKAERYGLGHRRYSAVLGVEPPHTPAEVSPVGGDPKRTGPRSAPRQKGRRFVVEGQVTTRLPPRKYDLL